MLQVPEGYRTLSVRSTVDDPDVDQIEITVRIKGHATLDSYVVERALLKHVGTNLVGWFQHCRDTGLKTIDPVRPIFVDDSTEGA